jgi:hypothetical protein
VTSCAQCGVVFKPQRSTARYCGDRCRVANARYRISGPSRVGRAPAGAVLSVTGAPPSAPFPGVPGWFTDGSSARTLASRLRALPCSRGWATGLPRTQGLLSSAIQEAPPPASIQINSGSSQGPRLSVLAQSNPSRRRIRQAAFEPRGADHVCQ